jgi:hypothetical protein
LNPTVLTWTIELIGWISALLILGSYILVTTGRLTGQSRAYQWMNVTGAAGFVVNTWWHGALPSAVLNVVWCLVGLLALWNLNRRRR